MRSLCTILGLTPRAFLFEVQPEAPHELVRVSYRDFSHAGHGLSH